MISGICGLVGRATTFVGGDVGSIPTCGALEVWQWTFGSRTVWLVNKSAGQLQFFRLSSFMKHHFQIGWIIEIGRSFEKFISGV